MTTTKVEPRQAILYARVSVNAHGEEVSTHQQMSELRAVAADKGYDVVAEFAESGFSASRYATKARKMFSEANAMLAAGQADAILFWDMDRLLRTPRELEDLIDLVDPRKTGKDIVVESVIAGALDLLSPPGRKHARDDAAAAAKEADLISIRVKRSRRAERGAGMPNPGPAYGWMTRIVPDPEQAPIVKEMWERVMDGESLSTVARDLNERGVPLRRQGEPYRRDDPDSRVVGQGTGWRPTTVRTILLTPRNYGLVREPGRTAPPERGSFEGILPPEGLAQVKAVLRSRDKGGAGITRRTSLTTGFVFCATCGQPMYRTISRGKAGNTRAYLSCLPRMSESACGHNRIPAAVTELALRDALCMFMDKLDLSQLLVDDGDAVAIQAEIDRLDAMMTDLRRRGVLPPSDPEFVDVHNVNELLSAARDRRDDMVKRFDAVATKRSTVLAQFANQGGALARAWDAPETTLDWRRRVLKAFLDEANLRIEVLPGPNSTDARRVAAGDDRFRLVPR